MSLETQPKHSKPQANDVSLEIKLDYVIAKVDSIETKLLPIQTHVANMEGAYKLIRGACLIGGIVIALVRLLA